MIRLVPEDFDFLLEWELEHALVPRLSPTPVIGGWEGRLSLPLIIACHLEVTRDEARDFFAKSIEKGLQSGGSLLGFDGNTLVLMTMNVVFRTPSNYKQLEDSQLPYYKLKDDYQTGTPI